MVLVVLSVCLNWLSAVQAAQGGAVGPGRHLQARDGQGRREPRAEGARGLGQGQGATRLLPDYRRRQVRHSVCAVVSCQFFINFSHDFPDAHMMCT